MSVTIYASRNCAFFGPLSAAMKRLLPAEPLDPSQPDGSKKERLAAVLCPACQSVTDEIDEATFWRNADADPRPEFRQALEWSAGKHFSSIDEMYDLYKRARTGVEGALVTSEA